MSTESNTTVSRFERVLAYVLVVLIAVSLIAFFAIMISTAMGMPAADYDTPLWRVIAFTPWIGLPVAFLFVIVLIIRGGRGRAKANARGGRR